MVGDSYTADVAGAERCGMSAILVRNPHPNAGRYEPDLVRLASRLGAM